METKQNIQKEVIEEDEDLYHRKKQLESIKKKIQNSSLIESNKKKILEFGYHCSANSITDGKTSRYLYDLYNLAEWLNKPFEDADKKDIERLMFCLENAKRKDASGKLTNKSYSEWTKRGYKIIVKKFYKWLRDEDDDSYPKEVRWIKTGMKECKKKLPKDMLTEDEVLSLIRCCRNERDKAMIAFLFDSGCRVGELLNMRIGDISNFSKGNGKKIYLRGKTGERRILIYFSAPYLERWLNNHSSGEKNAYVWVKENRQRLSYDRVRNLLRQSAKRAGLTKKVNPHNFRHSRCSIYSDRLKDRVLMAYFGWRRAETIAVYSHVSDEQIDGAISEANEVPIEEKKEKTKLKEKTCVRCEKKYEATALYCTSCGSVLDDELAKEMKMNELQREKADIIMDKIVNDPEIWDMMKKKYGVN